MTRDRQERDLYLALLNLGLHDDVEPFLCEALGLIVDATGARHGYVELHDPDGGDTPRWSMVHGFSAVEVEQVRSLISHGIIAQAVATGQTILTPCAERDPRFQDRESVRAAHIEAVLCAPIGEAPPLGVLYLEASGERAFREEDRATAELFARHVAPLVDRLLLRERTRENADATREARAKYGLETIVGRSPALAAVLAEVALVIPLEVSLLLTGPSGTGKSQLARAIHDHGPRRGGPFIDVNCAALPEALFESELFGAMPGAHSTASRRMEGKVAAAERGTLFLDEVADIPLPAQAKLLQLLQSREYYPLGAPRALTADVRVIAATNTDLPAAVAARRFRDDLFYRLNVVPIRVPSLAERREDIAALAGAFAERAAQRHRLPRARLSSGAMRALETAEWPGNIRQLEHVVEAAVIRAAGAGADVIQAAHLFLPGVDTSPAADRVETFQEATRRFQARLVREALEDSGWNVVDASRRLDLTRSHVYNLIRAFAIGRG